MSKFPCGCFPLAQVWGWSLVFPDLDKGVVLFELVGGKLESDGLGPGVTVSPCLQLIPRPSSFHYAAQLDTCTLHISDGTKMCCIESGKFAVCDFWPAPLMFIAKTPSFAVPRDGAGEHAT